MGVGVIASEGESPLMLAPALSRNRAPPRQPFAGAANLGLIQIPRICQNPARAELPGHGSPGSHGDMDVVDQSYTIELARTRSGYPRGRGEDRPVRGRSRLGLPAHAPRLRGQVAARPPVFARPPGAVLLRVPHVA